ncbi:MAG: TonB-dependent receptor, partial [Pseudomonadota bacterium]
MTSNSQTFLGLFLTTALAGTGAAFAQEPSSSAPVIAPPSVDEILIRGEFIPDEKRATSEISSVLDEIKFQRQGDSDIAAALRRVTGLSLAKGKFVYVRGLNERYSAATLNGSPIPSPEPLRRVAPLDLFPTSILSGSLVQKTFSPEYSGEFGGGLIDIRTKTVPDERFGEISISGSINTESNLRSGLSYEGSSQDFTGFDGGARNIPDAVAPFFATDNLNSGNFNDATLNEIGASFNYDDTLTVTRGDRRPNVGFSASYGDRFDVSDALSIGIVSTLGYGNEWETRRGEICASIFNQGAGTTCFESSDFTTTENIIKTNALFSAGFDVYDNHQFNLLGLVVRKTSKEAGVRFFESDIEDVPGRVDNTQFIERQVWVTQANGEHYFPQLADLSVDWRVSYSEAFRDSPYENSIPFVRAADGRFFYEPRADAVQLGFNKIEDNYFSGGIDFKLPVYAGPVDVELKAGYARTDNEREALDREYQINTGGLSNNPLAFRPPNEVFTPENFFNDLLQIDQQPNNAQFPGDSSGSLVVDAFYVGADAQLTDFLRAAVGFRYEDGSQSTTTAFIEDGVLEPQDTREINEDYFLPAVTLTWNFAENLQLRLGYSQTITRPQFRELTPTLFLDTDTEQLFVGNPFLQNAEIDNIDGRLEWYFGRDQFITIGGFYKDLTNPIEQVQASSGLQTFRTFFVNAPAAELYGAEFEFEKRFDLFDFSQRFDQDGWIGRMLSTKELILSANYTWSESEVQAGDQQLTFFFPGTNNFEQNIQQRSADTFIDSGRRLQGQSEHLANLQIGYQDLENNSRATLLVNYTSERIREAGTIISEATGARINDTTEQLPVSLDFVASREFQAFGGLYEIGFRAQNILNDDYFASSDA